MQLGLFPIFAEGFASPLNMITDIVIAAVMTFLVGFHISFIPSFLIEMFPMIDLAPTWTIAVLIATRKREDASLSPPPTSPEIHNPPRRIT